MISMSSGRQKKMNVADRSVKALYSRVIKNASRKYVSFLPDIVIFILVAVALGAVSSALSLVQTNAFFFTSADAALIVIPFLLVPFVFAFQSAYRDGEATTQGGVPSVLARFGLYYSGANFGSYRLVRNFIWSYLLSIVVTYVVGIVLFAVLSSDPANKEAFARFVDAISQEDLTLASSYLDEPPFVGMIYVISFTNIFVMLLFNIYFFLRALPIPYVESNIKNAPARLKVLLFRGGKRASSSHFEREYWILVWPFMAIGAAFLLIGSFIGMAIFGHGSDASSVASAATVAPIFGFYVAAIALSLLAPFLFEAIKTVQEDNREGYVKYGYDVMRQNLEYLKATQRMREEQANSLEEQIRNMQRESGQDQGTSDSPIDVEAVEKDPSEDDKHDDTPKGGGPSVDDYGRSDSH